MKDRTKQLALRTNRVIESMPRKIASDVLARQVVRSATSVAANCRSACRAKSRVDFISKRETVEEEADETGRWLELIAASGMVPAAKLANLHQEADEITAMVVSSIKTARGGVRLPQSAIRIPQSP